MATKKEILNAITKASKIISKWQGNLTILNPVRSRRHAAIVKKYKFIGEKVLKP